MNLVLDRALVSMSAMTMMVPVRLMSWYKLDHPRPHPRPASASRKPSDRSRRTTCLRAASRHSVNPVATWLCFLISLQSSSSSRLPGTLHASRYATIVHPVQPASEERERGGRPWSLALARWLPPPNGNRLRRHGSSLLLLLLLLGAGFSPLCSMCRPSYTVYPHQQASDEDSRIPPTLCLRLIEHRPTPLPPPLHSWWKCLQIPFGSSGSTLGRRWVTTSDKTIQS